VRKKTFLRISIKTDFSIGNIESQGCGRKATGIALGDIKDEGFSTEMFVNEFKQI
jgi:hypothetical protein